MTSPSHLISRRDLHEGWSLDVTDGPAPFAITGVPATVPGTFLTDLLAAGLIPDPYLDRHEHELAWSGEVDLTYRRTFPWAPRDAHRVDLVAAELDTAATVVLNGQVVATVQNQHRSWRFDVTQLLREGENVLEIRFASPLRTARENIEVLGDLPAVGNDLPYNAIRKMACNFGWDWGPVLVTSGISGPIGLEEWSTARLESVRPQVTVTDGRGVVDLRALVEQARGRSAGPGGDTTVIVAARLLDPAGERVDDVAVSSRDEEFDLQLSALDPQLWWPRGYGDQPLYTVAIDLLDADHVLLDSREHRVGFRTAGVVELPDEIGTSFTVTVNGTPILAKGANWIPDDCFPSRLTSEDYRAAVADAVDAGMNILRIWGGGLYASEELYELCDELGIMVWQDFAMACAAYSELEPLRSEVIAEAREHIVRLAWHPALVHWNGSNENVEGYYHWGWKESLPEGQGWGNVYYTEIFPALLAELDPSRSFTPSSPYSRPAIDQPRNADHGTVHNWVAWADPDDNDYTRYRDTIPRFSAEFGYQGPANWATLQRAITERPLQVDSATMLSHQKADQGQDKLERGMAPHLPPVEGFDDVHFATQLNQARALICGIGHYLSYWPRCGGTIVWQLNDCWPVTSWAAVDGDRRRKLLWYALRDLYAPLLITVQPRQDGPVVSVVNDSPAPLAGELRLRRQDLAGAVLDTATLDLQVEARSASTIPLPASLITPDEAPGEVLVVEIHSGTAQHGVDSRHGGVAMPIGRAVHFFAEDLDSELAGGAFEAAAAAVEGGVEITVLATSTVRDLCVLADKVDPDAVADRQLLTLLPGESATVRVRTAATTVPEAYLAETVLMSANALVSRARAREGAAELVS
ncbi:glycoside hydrolase family 2 protein [Brachybacterium sp. FME24]|uniref:glycoside hydrolase family 2 protein n=1 Tax=Brachybacterium sp. FME24 TaxID=2742605 RepID=UPI001D0133EE|nr:glycoside hydrolase family 2 protein [Brachybacterium sp. FME24]